MEGSIYLNRNKPVFALLLTPLFLILAGCTPAPPTGPSYCSASKEKTPQSTAWLAEHAIPFADSSASGSQDLMPLKQMIGNARVVALGEATHGTSEFFETKRRLLEFLVEQMGLNTFAMEVNGPEADRIDDYMQRGTGDPEELLAGLNVWPWNSHEVLTMIEWMRTHNQNAGTKTAVTFNGFDMQLPHAAMDDVARYVRKVDPANQQTESAFACYRQYRDATFAYASVDPTTQKKCREGLEQVYDDLEQQRTRYEEASSAAEYARALHEARLVLQAEERYRTMANRDLRDQFMAENVEWMLDQAGPQSKAVLWAHNTHVDAALPMTKSMGAYLRKAFGSQMVSVGFSFYAGSFNAMAGDSGNKWHSGVGVHVAATPPADSYESYFHRIGLPRFMLDLRALPAEENSDVAWMLGPHPFRSIGTAYDPSKPLDYCYDARLPDEFDLILYFDETSPSKLLGK